MATLAEQINQLAGAALAAHGLVLVHARLSGGTASGRGKLTLDVMAEMPDGTSPTLELCTQASRTLSAQMDVSDIIKSPYTLEVGSAGLERPLTKPADYVRFNGKQAKITLHRPVPAPNGKGVLGSAVGIISQPTDDDVTLTLKDGTGTLTVRHDQIHHAHLSPSAEELREMMKAATAKAEALKEAATDSETE